MRSWYRVAARKGYVPELAPEELLALNTFSNGKFMPESIALWRVFDLLATSLAGSDAWRTELEKASARHKVTPSTLAVFYEVADRHHETVRKRMAALSRRITTLYDLLGRARIDSERLSANEFLFSRDYLVAHRIASVSGHDLNGLLRAWRARPREASAAVHLPLLRERIGEDQFRALRGLFLQVVAPSIASATYREEGKQP